MESELEIESKDSSYTYWVRQGIEKGAPAPVPQKLSAADLTSFSEQSTPLGSLWNQLGTWEEKSINVWALERIKELLLSVEPVKFSQGKAYVIEVSSCIGDATIITVRNKKRVGYSFDITLKFKGEISLDGEDEKDVEGTLKLPDACFGELDDLQIEVNLTKEKDITAAERFRVLEELKLFLPALQEKLHQFESELKQR
ncbi:hypothetical protein O6H91_23G015300 [Diphasiastrum complanatum]|uniref:Uncharacterized protein n=2 Tax=Diphasiastrum complanatum TaxID=34168 RepID=A0ACC2A8C7_DIPCM|nr:hypothetical protein O6H91_23G015300 [Diphasiastrum complanatum]KAJ7513805.1 hypothetical protein O6H91_23G015300 [Diphasiastrum complanatum]